jgi:hypothetical protein
MRVGGTWGKLSPFMNGEFVGRFEPYLERETRNGLGSATEHSRYLTAGALRSAENDVGV